MKRKLVSLISVLILCLFCLLSYAPVAYAHPGRTDADGGHWDYSTGTYHYHDGSSAGKSRTNLSSDSSSDDYYIWYDEGYHTASLRYEKQIENATRNVLIIAIFYLLLLVFFMWLILRSIYKRKLSKQTANHERTLKEKDEQYNSCHARLVELATELAKEQQKTANLKDQNESLRKELTKATLDVLEYQRRLRN